MAPVKAPRSCPKSSDSTRSRGIAAQFSRTNGPAARAEARCTSDAATSFPVPDSPVISTRASVGATRRIVSRTRSRAALVPTSAPPSPSSACSARFSSRDRRSSSAASSVSSTASGVSGFSRKWNAPCRVARTASASDARPLIMITGTPGAASVSRGRASIPDSPSMYRSSSTASGSSCCISARAARADGASRVR